MKTYRTPGATATEWSPDGAPQTVKRLETVSFDQGQNSIIVPVTLTLRGETTKKGIRRTVLRTEALVNNASLGATAAWGNRSGTSPFSAHLVVQAPEQLVREDCAAATPVGAYKLLIGMLQDLIAVASNESTTINSDITSQAGLIAMAMCGANVLDTVSGTYGESTARS